MEMWTRWIPVATVVAMIALFIPATESKAKVLTSAESAVTMADFPTGGSGDFYKHVYCHPTATTRAILDIENYDIATGQRYKMDLDAVPGWTPQGIWFNYKKLSGWNNVYKDVANRGSANRIQGQWYRDPAWLLSSVSCVRTL